MVFAEEVLDHSAETTVVAEGLQSVKIDGAHFYKTYDCNRMPASENTYYQLSLQAAVDSVTVSQSVSFVFYAADRETKLGGSATVLELEGTAPFREFPSPDSFKSVCITLLNNLNAEWFDFLSG